MNRASLNKEHIKPIFTDASTTDPRDDMVLIRYWILCGNPKESMKSFTFLQPAPRSICKPFDKQAVGHNLSKDIPEQPEEFQNFTGLSKDLILKHVEEIAESQPWACVACKNPATALRSQHACFFFPEPGAKIECFVPMILGVYTPACPSNENGGVCSNTGFVMGTNYLALIQANNPWKNGII